MHYLIDGYNLLHQVGLLLGRVPPGRLEAASLILLRHLQKHSLNDPAVTTTVVFDALRSAARPYSRMITHGVEVYFAHSGEADDLIEELLGRAQVPQQMTVVSDDRRLQEAARPATLPGYGLPRLLGNGRGGTARGTAPAPKEDQKPGTLTKEEVAEWEKEFGDVEIPQDFEDLFRDADG